MNKSLAAQFNIRNNTLELQDYLKELKDWESDVKKKDKELRKGRDPAVAASASSAAGAGTDTSTSAPPAPRGRAAAHSPVAPAPSHLQTPDARLSKPGSTAGTKSGEKRKKKKASKSAGQRNNSSTPAGHTYEYYQDKWGKFDVDAALAESSSGEEGAEGSASEEGDVEQDGIPPVRQALDAEGWRAKGNEWFKLEDYRQAKECYDASISLAPTCLAHANRAMACLKLGEHSAAEKDCNEAISLDPCYLKAWQRRGTARLALGRREEAAADFEITVRLQPTSEALRREFQACVSALASAEKLLPLQARQALPIRDIGAATTVGAVAAQPESATNDTDANRGTETVQDKAGPPVSSVAERVAAAASAAVARVVASGAGHPVPKTATEFETAWKTFRGDVVAQGAYLSALDPPSLPVLFKNSMTGPLLCGVLVAIASGVAETDTERALALMEAVTTVPRFDMSVMLLPRRERAALGTQFDAMADKISSDDAARLVVLRQKMKM